MLNYLTGALLIMSFISSVVIEAIKILLKDKIKSNELLAFIVSLVFGILTYAYMYVFNQQIFIDLSLLKVIMIGLAFVISCCVCSQVGYDKFLKRLFELLEQFLNK